MAAGFRRGARIGVDDDDGRALGGARPAQRLLELGEARRLLGEGAEAGRMGAKVDAPAAWRGACRSSRLLKLSPPVARCRRLMQPKPRLSSTTIVSLRPSMTEVAISEFIIR